MFPNTRGNIQQRGRGGFRGRGRGRGQNRDRELDEMAGAMQEFRLVEPPFRGAPAGRWNGRGQGRGGNKPRRGKKGKNQPVQATPADAVVAVKDVTPGKPATEPTRTVNRLTSKLVLNLRAVIRPAGFHFTFFGILCYLNDWVLPRFCTDFGQPARTCFTNDENKFFFLKYFLWLCEGKIWHAYLKPSFLPAGIERPDINSSTLQNLESDCISMPLLLADIIKHIGKVTADGQELFPLYPATDSGCLYSNAPTKMTPNLIARYRQTPIPNFERLRLSKLNSIFGQVITVGGVLTPQATVLVNNEPYNRAAATRWNRMMQLLNAKGTNRMVELASGEGELGQLINSTTVPDPAENSNLYSNYVIPEGALAHGVALGVGVTPTERDRHLGLGYRKAVMIMNIEQNVVRSALTEL